MFGFAITTVPASCMQARGTISRPQPLLRRSRRSHAAAAAPGQQPSERSLFLFGLGYSGTAIARVAQLHGWQVYSACRRPDKYQLLESSTHHLLAFDPGAGVQLRDEDLHLLSSCSAAITTIPPVAAKLYDPVLRAQLQAVAAAAATPGSQLHWVGYLSSTGVYGDWQGAWVTEDAPPRTTTGRGLLRLEAEGAWAAAAQQAGLGITLFRLGGIYGPRRSIIGSLNKDHSQLSSSKQRRGQQKYISRCHVADIAAAVVGTLVLQQQHTETGQQQREQEQQDRQQQAAEGYSVDILNVVDDEPAPRAEVEAFAAQLLQLMQPSSSSTPDEASSVSGAAMPAAFGTQSAAPTAQEPGQRSAHQDEKGPANSASDDASATVKSTTRRTPTEEKRVSNTRLKQRLAQLGWGLAAPSYREGLQRVAVGDTSPFVPDDLKALFDV